MESLLADLANKDGGLYEERTGKWKSPLTNMLTKVIQVIRTIFVDNTNSDNKECYHTPTSTIFNMQQTRVLHA